MQILMDIMNGIIWITKKAISKLYTDNVPASLFCGNCYYDRLRRTILLYI